MHYLPHDEEVAAGLGGLDDQESQAVVDLLKPSKFCATVSISNAKLHTKICQI